MFVLVSAFLRLGNSFPSFTGTLTLHIVILAVPFVSLHNENDVVKWATWLNSNHAITTVGTSCQTIKQNTSLWDRNASLLRRLDEKTDHRLNWLVIGVASSRKIQDLRDVVRSFSLITTEPVQRAVRGQLLVNGKSHRSLLSDKHELTASNLRDIERRMNGDMILDFEERVRNCQSSGNAVYDGELVLSMSS